MYKHIKDCWNAIEKLTYWEGCTPDDLDNLLGQFPRWSGDWSWEVYESDDDYMLKVVNCYYDEQEESFKEEHDIYSPCLVFITKYLEAHEEV